MPMPLISIVIPCHNEAQSLPLCADELSRVIEGMSENESNLDFEFVLIDDGSKDQTLDVIKQMEHDLEALASVHWISFSRNFGKEAAIYAGLEHAQGDCVVLMDADLQDPPKLIPQMYEILQTGEFDCVATRRTTREGEPVVRSFFSRAFYRIMGKLSDIEIVDGARDFRMMNRYVVDAILTMSERNRFSKGIFAWVGFRTKWLEYENPERVAGNTSWSFTSLTAYALDGITAFSTVPLVSISVTGVVFSLIALVFLVVLMIRAALFGDPVAGWPSLMCAIILLGGLQMLSLGVVGQYLSKTYIEAKNRPLYVARETNIEWH